jgi:hypothetical protein
VFHQTVVFPKGPGVYHDFNFPINGWMSPTFLANGGTPKLNAGLRDLDTYSAQVFINVNYQP